MPGISITNQEEFKKNKLILLTGPTGYVGGRLLKILEENQFRLRCLARRPELLLPKVDSKTDVVKGDVLDRRSLFSAMNGVKIAIYLVHSVQQGHLKKMTGLLLKTSVKLPKKPEWNV